MFSSLLSCPAQCWCDSQEFLLVEGPILKRIPGESLLEVLRGWTAAVRLCSHPGVPALTSWWRANSVPASAATLQSAPVMSHRGHLLALWGHFCTLFQKMAPSLLLLSSSHISSGAMPVLRLLVYCAVHGDALKPSVMVNVVHLFFWFYHVVYPAPTYRALSLGSLPYSRKP